jgi:hypothetical protein
MREELRMKSIAAIEKMNPTDAKKLIAKATHVELIATLQRSKYPQAANILCARELNRRLTGDYGDCHC